MTKLYLVSSLIGKAVFFSCHLLFPILTCNLELGPITFPSPSAKLSGTQTLLSVVIFFECLLGLFFFNFLCIGLTAYYTRFYSRMYSKRVLSFTNKDVLILSYLILREHFIYCGWH